MPGQYAVKNDNMIGCNACFVQNQKQALAQPTLNCFDFLKKTSAIVSAQAPDVHDTAAGAVRAAAARG
jgi:hypothetical protein